MAKMPEPTTCPRCATVTWADERATVVRCRYCDFMYPKPHADLRPIPAPNGASRDYPSKPASS